MSRVRLLGHLALADARTAWRQTALAMTVLTAAGAALALALALRAQAEVPWQRAFDAAQGAHVVASAPSRAPLEELVARSEVQTAGLLAREVFGTLRVDGRLLLARVVESVDATPPVDQPLFTAGSGPEPGGVVIESTAAAALGLDVSDRLQVGRATLRPGAPPDVTGAGPGRDLRVSGIARVMSQTPFPASQPGLVLMSPADLDALGASRGTGFTVGVRLDDPGTADAFAQLARASGVPMVGTWQEERDEALDGVRTQRAVVGSFAVLLLLVAAAATATLVSTRVVSTARRTAMLRALGLTPREAQGVQVLQHAVIAASAAVLGCAVAALLAPRVTTVAAGVLGAGPLAPSPVTFLVVVTSVVGIAAGAAYAATSSWVGASTMGALRRASSRSALGPARISAPAERLGAGVPVALALRGVAAKPVRTLLAAAGIALSVAAAVACAGMEATLAAETTGTALPGFLPPGEGEQLRPLAYVLLLLLVVLSLAGLSATTASNLTETARDDAALSVLGLTPAQAAWRSWCSSTAVALVATLAGLPLGYLLLRVSYVAADGTAEGLVAPAATDYLAVLAIAVPVVAAWTTLQTSRARSGPVADRLRTV